MRPLLVRWVSMGCPGGQCLVCARHQRAGGTDENKDFMHGDGSGVGYSARRLFIGRAYSELDRHQGASITSMPSWSKASVQYSVPTGQGMKPRNTGTHERRRIC